MMKKALSILLFFPIISLADNIIATMPALVGGLKPDDMAACQKMLDKKCRRQDTPFVAYQDDCVAVLFKNEQMCQQNAAILQATGLNNAVYDKSVGNIDIFRINHPADGLQSTYLVTQKGYLIPLRAELQLLDSQYLQQLQKHYPNITLSDIAFGDVSYQNDPVKGTETLTLKQFLLSDGTMASHTENCYVNVVYEFSMNGEFNKIIPITMLSAGIKCDF